MFVRKVIAMKSLLRSTFLFLLFGAVGLSSCQQTNDAAPQQPASTGTHLVTTKLADKEYRFVVVRAAEDSALVIRWNLSSINLKSDTLTYEFEMVGLYRVQATLRSNDSTIVRTLDTTIMIGDLPLDTPPAAIFQKCDVQFRFFGSYTDYYESSSGGSTWENFHYVHTASTLDDPAKQTVTDSTYSGSDGEETNDYYKSGWSVGLNWRLSNDLRTLRSFSYSRSSFSDHFRDGGRSSRSMSVKNARFVGANDSQAVYIVDGPNARNDISFSHSNEQARPPSKGYLVSINWDKSPESYALVLFKKR